MLRKVLGNKTVVLSPDLPAKPYDVIRMVVYLTRDHWMQCGIGSDQWVQYTADGFPNDKNLIFVGSSLGGFYARYLSIKCGGHCVLINPAINPAESLRQYVGTTQGYYSNKFVWKDEYCNELAEMDRYIVDTHGEGPHTHLFTTKDDDVCPPDDILRDIPYYAWHQCFDDGGHRQLDHFPEVVDYINNAFFEYKKPLFEPYGEYGN